MVYWTDSTPRGAISVVSAGIGYVYRIKIPDAENTFLEITGVLSAISFAASLPSPPQRVLIWTDSLDGVWMFDGLKSKHSMHNSVLLGAASLAMRSGIDVRVRHINGKENVRADLLSTHV
jgi:hypothetical protein